MPDIPPHIQQSYLLYGLLLAAALCLVFGIGSLFEPARTAIATARRATPMRWAASGLSAGFAPREERERDALRVWLLQAGYDAPRIVDIYFGLRGLSALAFAAMVGFGLPLYPDFPSGYLPLAILGAAIVGFFAPFYALRSKRLMRQRKFRDGLPDALDLLLVCSEAGLGIDTALLTVGDEIAAAHPLLAQQLQHVSSALRAGRERKDAMRSFAERTGIEETVSLVNLLVQADALGTSMAQTLRAFSEDMRAHRMLKAEEQGHKVSAKLTVVLVACFMPATFAAILAPAIYSAIQGIAGLTQVQPW